MELREELRSWPGHIDASGRLLIPAESRQALGWDRGTDVVIESDGDSLRVITLDRFTQEVQALFGRHEPGRTLMSDELIAERRAEAVRETARDGA